MKSYSTIGAYIAAYPKDVQTLLKKMRATIQRAAPKARQKMAYGIPTFYLNGNLAH